MRKPIIAGNWKMNKLPCEGAELVEALKSKVADAQCEVVVCVPFVDLVAVAAAAKGSNIKVGAQNMHWEKSGAFTGEISADMLKAVGAQYVVLGHSERRQYFAETDETVNKKVLAAVANGLTPIICVGESLQQRENGETDGLVSMQTVKALEGLTGEQVQTLITGRALSREDILAAVWGRDYEGELKIVDVNIRRLRIKIEDDTANPTYITTVWGLGYKWGA